METNEHVEETLPPGDTVGARLRAAREGKGYELDQIAAETRIPRRHLEAIEADDFAALPSRTYAIGFSRTYARAVDLDENEVIAQVREQLATGDGGERMVPAKFEPGDPARVPGRGLAWFAVIAAILLLGGIYAFYRSYLAPGLGPAPLQDETEQVAANEPAPAATASPAAPTGPVVFTNEVEGTWVRFYDDAGESLYEGIMAVGDTFTVPEDARNPQIRTGRPYAFAITVGGQSVPRISEEDEVVSDVPVTAEALLERSAAPASSPATAAPAASPPAG
ncbi:helix-turn-helix domain-containing protein [Qipengyuania sp. XHP0207]|uniref:helix-turn-helix domain-containing protein n=1 Tax=Qipengyuania sp. XHP0207 TaxID=3038078 RepID=UPI00241EF97C|nr:helix-turn-helix domain-containing protein [Qipengyuania sp. XHP0207]MDG5749200.1 helix-turn-helix domain-containing protein [Qipengyuania sp. XHP0207]